LFLPRFDALRSAFSNRNYAIYVSGNSLSLIGFWMQRMAVSWLAWEITHSAFWVAAVAFAEIGPLILIGPLFGVWADRLDRKMLAITAQSLMMLQAFVLFALLIFDRLSIGLLFGLTLVEGIIHAAYQPVRLSIIPNLVRKADLVAAAAFTAVVFNVARFVGPAIAGIVMAVSSPAYAILFNGISYGLILYTWRYIKLPFTEKESHDNLGFWGDVKAGLSYVRERQALMAMFILLTLIALFARPVTFILSAFVGGIYEEGPETLALFTSSIGIGAVLAGMRLSMDGLTKGLIRSILVHTLVLLVALVLFALCQNKWLASVLIFQFGYSVTIAGVASQTLIQNRVNDQMRGRVLSLWVACTRGAPAIGVLAIGWIANFTGLVIPTICAAFICLIGLVIMNRQRKLMRHYFEEAD
jgi:MFS family permease